MIPDLPDYAQLLSDENWRLLWASSHLTQHIETLTSRVLNPSLSEADRRDTVNKLAGINEVQSLVKAHARANKEPDEPTPIERPRRRWAGRLADAVLPPALPRRAR